MAIPDFPEYSLVEAAQYLSSKLPDNYLPENIESLVKHEHLVACVRLGDRLLFLYEDGVTGTASGYNQANYYSGGGSGVMGGYESLGDPVPAAQMVYNNVGRALLGGYDGQAGSVPAAVTDLMTASYTFNYTVPSSQNRENMHAVALLIDQTNGEIVNAGEIPIPPANIGLVNNETIGMSVFPNPANDILNVSFEFGWAIIVFLL